MFGFLKTIGSFVKGRISVNVREHTSLVGGCRFDIAYNDEVLVLDEHTMIDLANAMVEALELTKKRKEWLELQEQVSPY